MRGIAVTIAAVVAMVATAAFAQHGGGGIINNGPLVQPVVSNADPTANVLPSYDDAWQNWKVAGLTSVGGIPNRTTQCGSTLSPIGGISDDAANIKAAIAACTPGDYVQLSAGTFNVHQADFPITIQAGISLRGTGSCTGSSSPYCSTVITTTDGLTAYTGGLCQGGVGCTANQFMFLIGMNGGQDYNFSWAQCSNYANPNNGTQLPQGLSCGAVSLGADAAQGDTTIQVAQTSAFTIGEWTKIDENSGAAFVTDPNNSSTGFGTIYAASDALSSNPLPVTGRIIWSKASGSSGSLWDGWGSGLPTQVGTPGCYWGYCNRPTSEYHVISSIGAGPCPGTNCTLTFDSPLTTAYRISGSHAAQVYPGYYANQSGTGSPAGWTTFAGIENVSLLRAPNGTINFDACAYCWAKNVEVGDWNGGGIFFGNTARDELNTVYVHHCWFSTNSGGEYPVDLSEGATEILVTNSIMNFGGKGMTARDGGAGSVVSYNYLDDQMYDSFSQLGDEWEDLSLNGSHYEGPHHILFEGNWSTNIDNDDTHGNANYQTFFRNNSKGHRTPFTDPSLSAPQQTHTITDVPPASSVGYACTGSGPSGCTLQSGQNNPGRTAAMMMYNYWMAFVGNVLGDSGVTTSGNGWVYSSSGQLQAGIWLLGWSGFGTGVSDVNLSSSTCDGTTGSYCFRHQNYDYFHSSIVDSKSSLGYSNTLPNSFYLSAAPSFFSSGSGYPWPWVTPTSASPIQTGPSGCGGTCSALPAQARWQAGTPFVQP